MSRTLNYTTQLFRCKAIIIQYYFTSSMLESLDVGAEAYKGHDKPQYSYWYYLSLIIQMVNRYFERDVRGSLGGKHKWS